MYNWEDAAVTLLNLLTVPEPYILRQKSVRACAMGHFIFFSVVFTPPPPSHHGSVWLLPVIEYRGFRLAYPYDWRGFVGAKKKASVGLPQSTYECRVQSSVWRLSNTDLPPPSPPSECVLPPHNGGGVNILKDARHWIGLLQYDPSTGLPIVHYYFMVHSIFFVYLGGW